jgi:hypothetical protein
MIKEVVISQDGSDMKIELIKEVLGIASQSQRLNKQFRYRKLRKIKTYNQSRHNSQLQRMSQTPMKSCWWLNNSNLSRPTPSRLTLKWLLLKNHQSHKPQVNHSKNNRIKKNRTKNNPSKRTFCNKRLSKREPNSLKSLKSKAIPNKNQTYLNRMLLKLNRMTMLFDSLLMYMISFNLIFLIKFVMFSWFFS